MEEIDGEDETGESEEETNKIEKGRNKEIYWILGVMAGLVVVFFVSSYVIKGLNTFEYEGLTFAKEKFGEIPVFHYYYFPRSPINGQVIGQYNLYLRGDPRENNVPIDGEIVFPQERTIYVSVNGTGLTQCTYSSVALANLAGFLSDHQFKIKGATPGGDEATANNLTWATCEGRPGNIVILVQSGNETKITKQRDNCHVINVANCEVLPAIEKFEVQALLDARTRAGLR